MSAAEKAEKIVDIKEAKAKYLPADEYKWQREVIVDLDAWNNMTLLDMEAYNDGMGRARNVRGAAKVLAKIITHVPEAWGQADNPETYLKLPRYLLERLSTHITDEISGKN